MDHQRARESVDDVRQRLRLAIEKRQLPNYVYSYPSKRAYRVFDPPKRLESIWGNDAGPVNLYLHVPFCGYHCYFCTLFLTTSQTPELVDAYVRSLERQIATYGRLIGHREVVSIYFGGGTPTVLENAQFSSLFAALHAAFPKIAAGAEISIEGSPDTMPRQKLEHLKQLGVNRVSMGLQTLDDDELRKVGRPYSMETAYETCRTIGSLDFDNVNYDLMYGLEAQTRDSWFRSLAKTLEFSPTTVTLYPVVFRPLTVIQKLKTKKLEIFANDASKYDLYDESVPFLLERGFHQDTFVRFTTLNHDGYLQEKMDFHGVPLVGLGAGSRSYTESVHYGTDFAVGRSSTMDIIHGFVGHPHRPDETVGLGFELDDEERRRRHIILTLSLGGLNFTEYSARFGKDIRDDFAVELEALRAEGCLEGDGEPLVKLTHKGFKHSSLIATLFYSDAVGALERTFVPR